jgi:ABC-type nitrate/sulfonate/bicarbonate transport system substrate-binding protein
MSTLLETTNAPARPAAQTVLTDVYYTICPVFNAANVAVELGWLDEEFKKVGARALYLRSLKDNAGWIPHYTHSLPNLIRDGGSIPTIQAKADLADTKLIGLTATQSGGQIVVRADSSFHRVADLKGRRFGLFKSLNRQKIDFVRATAEFGLTQALAIAGLKRSDVEIVDLEEADTPEFLPAAKPSELWSQSPARRLVGGQDLEALREKRIDAIYSHPGRSVSLAATGEFKVIEDLNRYPDWTLRVTNGPLTAAINTEFAEQHPEVVVAYLRAAIRAGHWINAHREAAAEIFLRVSFSPSAKWIARTIADFDFVPNLSAQNLAATEIEKNFLLDHGYVKNDFDVRKWADPSFLEWALSNK